MSRSFQTFLFETQGRKRINPLRINPLRINPLRINPLRINPLRINPLRLFTKLCRLKFTIC